MKDLKRGDFVWHKDYGRGIVLYDVKDPAMLAVQFENRQGTTYVHRKTLFVKGDYVKIKTANYNLNWHKDKYFFFEPLFHNPSGCDSKFTVTDTNCGRIKYCTEVKHQERIPVIFNEEQKLLDTVIEKTITNHPISAINISRTVYRAGQLADIGIKAENVLKKEVYTKKYNQPELDFDTATEKEQLLKRIEILELQAKIRELES